FSSRFTRFPAYPLAPTRGRSQRRNESKWVPKRRQQRSPPPPNSTMRCRSGYDKSCTMRCRKKLYDALSVRRLLKAGNYRNQEGCSVPTTVRIPSYRLHKPTGKAVVTLNGKDVYLGPYGSPESKAEYRRRIAEWSASGGKTPRF